MKNFISIFIFFLTFQIGLYAQEKNLFNWLELETRENNILISDKTDIGLNLYLLSVPDIAELQIKSANVSITMDSLENKQLIFNKGDTTIILIKTLIDKHTELENMMNPANRDSFTVKLIRTNADSKEFSFSYGKEELSLKADPTKIPIPYFLYYDDESDQAQNKRNRVLIIDANPNPEKKQHNLIKKFNSCNELVPSNHLYVNSNLSVFIKNYSFRLIDKIEINISGSDYSYSKDIGDLFNLVNNIQVDSTVNNINATPGEGEIEKEAEEDLINDYFQTVVDHIYKEKYVNINDYLEFKNYVDTLTKACINIPLSTDAATNLYLIQSWKPEFISLTPVSKLVPDKDEVEFTLTLKENNKEQIYPIGNYKTIGGSVTTLSTSIFITNLVNNKIYTDSLSVVVNDSLNRKELRAFMKDKKTAVGMGLNIETSFRTGCAIRPIINVGMFVPFEEDITPYLAIGIGGALVLKKIKISLAGGFAGGFINEVNSKYKDKDLSKYPNYAEDLYDKTPKGGWQINFGVSFNID